MALVILMRHGEAGNNVDRILAGRKLEYHLTERGEKQVKNTSLRLKNANIKAVYTSPITRTIETASIVCNELGLDYRIDDRLIETDMGSLTGIKYNEVIERYGNLFAKFYEDDEEVRKMGVETFSNIKKRVKDILEYVAEKHSNENVLLITHLDPVKAAVSHVITLDPLSLYKMAIPNASLTMLRHGSSDYTLVALNVMDIERYSDLAREI